jgi:hypothetical protein
MSRSRASAKPALETVSSMAAVGRRWLILVHQLPATPSNLRVRTWRRLQELGAVAVKQAVYVLPDTPECREDFEWLRVEIEGSGGEALVFGADRLDPAAEAALVEEFRRTRQQAYAELASDLQHETRAGKDRQQPARRRRDLARYRQRLTAIERVDFFSGAGRDRVVALLANLEGGATSAPGRKSSDQNSGADQYHSRLWVTRPRPGVDRMASAWLIRRFVDANARFAFITDVKTAPANAVPFDMFGGGFGHEVDRCTFETLQRQFELHEPALARLAEIVHDLDLKDAKFAAPEASMLAATIDGLQLSCADDQSLLEQGMVLFEALYRSFAQATRPPKPRPVAARKRKSTRRA